MTGQAPLKLVATRCCVCGTSGAPEVGAGLDYEYDTSPDTFHALRCESCGLVYLDPRPDVSELDRIYPPTYHALDFSPKQYGLVHRVRSRLEAMRLLRYCDGAPEDARILDVGCGDGFHLDLLARYGRPSWSVEGIDLDPRAVEAARRRGLTVHQGSVEDLDLGSERYDVAYTIQTIEHVAHPERLVAAIYRLLKPGGRLVVVTDNTDSLDFRLFKRSYWGGYHFPRHFNLFGKRSLGRLAQGAGFEVADLGTIVSPVNWVYSIHNWLVARRSSPWLVSCFTLKSPVSLGVFTLVDMALQKLGRGALLNAYFRKPVVAGSLGR